MKKKDNIIFTGGSGKFGRIFRGIHKNKEILYPKSNQLNINVCSDLTSFRITLERLYSLIR